VSTARPLEGFSKPSHLFRWEEAFARLLRVNLDIERRVRPPFAEPSKHVVSE
jgi:hypothetical protein